MIINRWFHKPVLHVPEHGHERKVGWLELFYDLIYVATLIQLGNALANNISISGVLLFAGMFVPIWFTWTGFTFYSNRFVVDDAVHRSLVFVQMFAIGAVAVGVPEVYEGNVAFFSISYAVTRLILVALYLRTWKQVDEGRGMTGRYALGFAAGACVWITSAFVPTPWAYIVWGIALIIDFAVPIGRAYQQLVTVHPPDVEHMVERYGLLTIIVLGESFVKILTALVDAGPTLESGLLCAMALSVTCSLWWIYFDDVAGSRMKAKRLAPWIWIYSHLPLTLAITTVGVGVKKAVLFDLTAVAPAKYRWLLCGALAAVFFFVGAIDSVTERRHSELADRGRVNVRVFSALAILLFAQIGQYMVAWVFLAFIAGFCLLQVLFDLLMAPTADSEAEHEEDAQQVFHKLREMLGEAEDEEKAVTDGKPKPRLRPDGSLDPIRRGVPNELRRDLYFHFMEGSWSQLLGSMLVLYLVLNVVFAALFMLEPGSISNVHDGNFIEAFAFSVQTMSTIGYGAYNPQTNYAHTLVTIEAAIGLLGVAVATGVIFAKLARPQSSVLFSEKVVITVRYGVPTLMFRLANARGNEIVEANIRVSALCDDVSPEGHNLRTLFDLKLRRDTSPVFTMSWSVIHEIDEDSPFYGVTEENLYDRVNFMVVTLKGFDATYSQTVHARHMYTTDKFVFGHRLVDVVSTLDDGRLMINYAEFHHTEPDEHWDPSVFEEAWGTGEPALPVQAIMLNPDTAPVPGKRSEPDEQAQRDESGEDDDRLESEEATDRESPAEDGESEDPDESVDDEKLEPSN